MSSPSKQKPGTGVSAELFRCLSGPGRIRTDCRRRNVLAGQAQQSADLPGFFRSKTPRRANYAGCERSPNHIPVTRGRPVATRAIAMLVQVVDAAAVAIRAAHSHRRSAGEVHHAGLIDRSSRGGQIAESEGAGDLYAFDDAGLHTNAVAPRDIFTAYRTARAYRRCRRLLARVDRAIDRGDRRKAERLMGRVKVVLAGVAEVTEPHSSSYSSSAFG